MERERETFFMHLDEGQKIYRAIGDCAPAFGMVGTSLSGVTFVSVPGAVALTQFSYLQITLGYVVGYFVVAFVLLPLYYRWRLTSIYGYLGQRLGPRSYQTGAAIFIASRTLGATARLYLVVKVLQDMILDSFGVPFWLTAAVILLMIVLYTVCLLYTSPSPRDRTRSRMPSSA